MDNDNIDNDAVDLVHLMEVLDAALSSDNPAMKDLLRKLLMTAALVSAPSPEKAAIGPFRRIFDEVDQLRKQMRTLQDDVRELRRRMGHPKDELYGPGVSASWKNDKIYKDMATNYFKEQYLTQSTLYGANLDNISPTELKELLKQLPSSTKPK
jgi:hypothetical protein